MKSPAIILLLTAIVVAMFSCGGSAEQKSNESETIETAKVVIYYFHSKQRCKTCLAIQNLAVETIAANFSENKDVKFLELDFSEKANEAISEKYEVAGSSLIVASGNEHTNLTELAFANAIRNPETLKGALINQINSYLIK